MISLNEPRLLVQRAWVGGRWVEPGPTARSTILNPSTGEPVGIVPLLGAAEARAAIAAAHAAQPGWRAQPAAKRAEVLRRWHTGILQHTEDLAWIMTLEQGKPLAEARAEIVYAAAYVEWFAEEAKRIYGDIIPAKSGDRRLFVTKEPVGVCAAITPWNFPAAMVTRKVAPALAAGCAVVLKPAPQTPFTALALAWLAEAAGLPTGLLSVITGDAEAIGGEFTSNALVRKLSFTGSTKVGRLLMAQCAPTVKRVSLELGGNAPFLVFADADLDAAVEGLIASKYRNSGQTCVCANRILVQEDVLEPFLAKLVPAVARLGVGDGFEPGVLQGPLIDQAALGKVEWLVADALARGANARLGGKRHARGGTFYEPTILTGITPAMEIAAQEIFGPVAALSTFATEADAMASANATESGLAAYFYTRDPARIWRVLEALECGMVGVNTGLISTETAPFGGSKQSGIGREGSRYGIDEYVELKYACLAGL